MPRCRWTRWSKSCATAFWWLRFCRSRSCSGPLSAARCCTSACPHPLGCDDVFQLILSLPVIGYSVRVFFDGAISALRARTLDMNVLVAIAIAAGWTYSVIVTLRGGGDVFYEASTVLSAFVLLGHWLEMRARGGANDAVRALLDLARRRQSS